MKVILLAVTVSAGLTACCTQLHAAQVEIGWDDNEAFQKSLTLLLTNASAGVMISTPRTDLFIQDNEMPANLDLSFDPDLNPLASTRERGRIYAIQPDGKILAAWRGGQGLVRLNPDGSQDDTFRRPPLSRDGSPASLNQVVLGPDAKVFISGYFDHVGSVPRFGLARLQYNWSLDSDFVPPSSYGPDFSGPSLLLVQRDGKPLVVVGYGPASSSSTHLFRLQQSGAIDELFKRPQFSDEGYSLAAVEEADGRIIVSGGFCRVNGAIRSGLVRLLPDGSVDEAFQFASQPRSRVEQVLVQEDLGLVVSGWIDGCWNVRRLRFDGSNDAPFQTNFEATFPRTECIGDRFFIVQGERNRLLIVTRDGWFEHSLTWLNDDGAVHRKMPSFRQADLGDYSRVVPFPQLHHGALLVAGTLGAINGVSRPVLARILLDGIPENAVAINPAVSERALGTDPVQTPVWQGGYWFYEGPPAIRESDGTVKFHIRRLGDSQTAITVEYTTRDGSAKVSQDYMPASGTLAFAPLEVEKTVTVQLIDDGVREPEETFELVLTTAAAGVPVSPATSVTIQDDEPVLTLDLAGLATGRTASLTLRLRPTDPLVTQWSIEASSDFNHWTSLPMDGFGYPSDGFQWGYWRDDQAHQFPARFYRAVAP